MEYQRFWAKYLGIEPSAWAAPGVSVSAHVGLADYHGLWSFRHLERVVVSAPRAWVPKLEAMLVGADRGRLTDVEWWRSALGERAERLIGPAYHGYIEPGGFTPAPDRRVELCGASAAEALAEFRAAVTDEAWSDGGLGTVTSHVALLREGSRIAAMSGYRPWTESVGDPCILVHPEWGGRGFGTAVASAAVAAALSDGKTVLYQTLDANMGSLAIARKLGFRRFASYLAVRLSEGAD